MIQTRLATAADATTVADLVYRLIRELADLPESDEKRAAFRKSAAELFGAPDERCWAILAIEDAETEPFGVMTLNECAAIYAGGRFGEISELYVAPELRSEGIAPRLLERAVSLGRERGWGRIEVGAPSQPRWARTVAFYERQGFEEIGPRLCLMLPPSP